MVHTIMKVKLVICIAIAYYSITFLVFRSDDRGTHPTSSGVYRLFFGTAQRDNDSTTVKGYNAEMDMRSNAEYTMRACQSLNGDAKSWFYEGKERDYWSRTWTSITKRFSLLFTPVAKCGWTTWQVLFFTDAGKLENLMRDSRWAWDNNYKDVGLSTSVLRYLNGSIDNFKDRLVMVRDPYDRLVSAYKDKALHANGLYTKVKHLPCKWFNSSFETTLTFPQFVQCLITNARQRIYQDPLPLSSRKAGIWLDLHWAPQSHLTVPCLARYNLVGKYDKFKEQSDFMIQRLGLNASLTNQNSGQKKSGRVEREYNEHNKILAKQPLEYFYGLLTSEQLAALKEIYRYDFELFGFKPDPPRTTSR